MKLLYLLLTRETIKPAVKAYIKFILWINLVYAILGAVHALMNYPQ